MTSIGKNCYTDRIVLDDDIVLKSLPSGKYLVSGEGGKISFTNEIPLVSGTNQTVDGIKTFTSLIQGSVSGTSASCGNSATTDKLNNKLNIGTNLTLASGEDEWDAENEDTINLDLDLSSYARKDQANSFSGTQTFVQKIVGNIDTANKLKNARTIGGVSFDGSANINLPGVNQTGDQDTTGTAASVINGVYTTGNQTIEGTKTFESANNHKVEPTEISYDLVYGQGGGTFSGTAPSLMHSGSQMWFRSKDNNNESQFHFATMLSGDTSYGQTGYLRLDVHSTEGITFNSVGKNWSSSTVPDMGFLSQTKQYNFHGGSGNRIYIDCDNFEIAKYSSGSKVSNGITFNGNLTGNANTATSLQTARTIAGVSFDGGSNIDLASTGLSDTNTLIRNTDDRLTKISTNTNSSQNQYTYTFDLTSSNQTYQTYDFKGNNSSIAVFDINQIMFSANIYVLPSKYITYPYGTAGEFIKLDSSQNMVSTTISTSDISGINNYALSTQVATDISTAINNLNINQYALSSDIPTSSSDLSDTNNICLLNAVQTHTGKKTFSSGIEVSGINGTSGNTVNFGGNIVAPITSSETGKFYNIDTGANVDLNVKRNGSTIYKAKSSGLELAVGSITSTTGSINFDNENLTTTGSLTINKLKTFDSGVPVIFGNDLSSQSDSDIIAICQSNSTSTRKFAISNLSTGASYLKLSNSEGSFLYGTNENKMFLYRESDNSLLQAIDSDKTHIFYSPVSITGDLLTTGKITTDKQGTFGSLRIFDSTNDDNTIIDIFGDDDANYTRGYISCSNQTGKFQRLYIRMENVNTVLFRDTSTLFYTNVSLQNNNLLSVGTIESDEITASADQTTQFMGLTVNNNNTGIAGIRLENQNGMYQVQTVSGEFRVYDAILGENRLTVESDGMTKIPKLIGSDNIAISQTRFRRLIKPTDMMTCDDSSYARMVIYDATSNPKSYGGVILESTAPEVFIYQQIPQGCRVVGFRIVVCNFSGTAVNTQLFRSDIVYPAELKDKTTLFNAGSGYFTNADNYYQSNLDVAERTQSSTNLFPQITVQAYNSTSNVFKGGWFEYEYV